MKSALLCFALCLGCAAARADILLYDNSTTDTLDTILYSTGPYTALGDQIHLVSAGIATQAKVQLYNNGQAGVFDAELDFFSAGSPVGSPFGTFHVAGIASAGSDVIDVTFALGAGLAVPQDLVFTVSVSNWSANMDLGLNMFEPPAAGTSDPSFLIAAVSGTSFSQLRTNGENVYFQLSGSTGVAAAPEPGTSALLGIGLLAWRFRVWSGRRSAAGTSKAASASF
ncbi:MAG: PEP-CTERM sorting domain-containing protein [Acidobacteriota bacterium]